MIFLVVADIHGNLDAFEAVLGAESGSFDALLFLGDATGYGPDPEATVSLLRSLASSISTSVFLAGNHDGALFGRVDPEWFNPRLRGSFDRTRALLSRESIDWLADRKPCATPLPGILACHGSPRDPYAEYLWGGPETLASLDGLAATGLSLCFVGHTHEAAFFARDAKSGGPRATIPAPGSRVWLGDEPTIVNPGSVGFPRAFPGYEVPRPERYPAYYAVWDSAQGVVEFREVLYDRRPVERRLALAAANG